MAQSTRLANEGTRFNNRTPKSWYAMTAKEKNDGVILNTTSTDLLARAPIPVPRLASTGARAQSGDATDARPTDGRAAPVFRLGASHAHRGQSSSRARDRVRCLLCCRDADAVHCGCGDRLSAERHLRAEATDRRHSGQYEARAHTRAFCRSAKFCRPSACAQIATPANAAELLAHSLVGIDFGL